MTKTKHLRSVKEGDKLPADLEEIASTDSGAPSPTYSAERDLAYHQALEKGIREEFERKYEDQQRNLFVLGSKLAQARSKNAGYEAQEEVFHDELANAAKRIEVLEKENGTLEKDVGNLLEDNHGLRESNIGLQVLAQKDGLTGLNNRRQYDERLDAQLSRVERGKRFGLIMFDLDNFKNLNDTYGHACGDNVLKAVARAAIETVRGYDVVSRYGGEEFTIIAPDIGENALYDLCERLRENITKTCADDGSIDIPIPITTSIGCTLINKSIKSDEANKLVDVALYKAKDNGRNNTVYKPLL